MEGDNKMKSVLEKAKVNVINIVSITLSVIAIVLSIIAISGNVNRRNFRPREANYAYENRMPGQGYSQNPNGPGVGYNWPNGGERRSFKRVGPKNQQGMDAQSGPTPKAFPSPQDQQKPQGPNDQQNNTTN